MPYTQVEQDIRQIIDGCRLDSEAPFYNTVQAAENIIKYLQKEDLLSETELVRVSELRRTFILEVS